MHQDELRKLLTDIAAERLALLQRHEASARAVSHYDFNNTYQYVINREELHLRWLSDALADFGAPLPPAAAALPTPEAPKSKKSEPSAFGSILDEDARGLTTFADRWRDRVQTMTHVRHRNMVNVILGESREHARLFAQAASGMEDVLGRRTTHAERVGGVLPTRWQE